MTVYSDAVDYKNQVESVTLISHYKMGVNEYS